MVESRSLHGPLPVYANADEYVSRQEESEYPEEWENPA